MHLLYRYLSQYVDFLQGLKKMRPRLLVFMALLAFACFSLALKEGAPPASRAILALTGGILVIALLAALAAALMRDTLFISGAPHPEIAAGASGGDASSQTPPDPQPQRRALLEGEGVTARVSGRLELSRYGQAFSNVAGGVIREEDRLHIVVPNQAFHVLRGISAEHCRSWWRRTLDGGVRRIDVGTLWMAGRPMPALRFVHHRFDRVTVGLVEPDAYQRVLETLRALDYPVT